jgi:ornithine carbamoyltransferase
MGEEPDVPDWRSHFQGFKVTRGLMHEVGSERAIFMHDLPATRGSEVENEVMDGASSRIRRQAFNKAISAMVTLKWCTPRQRPPMP